MVSSCYSGGKVVMNPPQAGAAQDGTQGGANYHTMFPNVQTILAYEGSSPSIATGSPAHMKRWEHATQGKDVKSMDPNLEQGYHKGENVAVWSAQGGYQANASGVDEGASEFMERLRDPEVLKTIAEFDSGAKDSVDPDSGDLKMFYDTIQLALGNPDVKGADRDWVQQQKDKVLRLRYYHAMRQHFGQAYANDLKAGYAEVGIPMPDYSQLSRKDALAQIQQFLARAQGHSSPSVTRCAQLLEGLKDLSPSVLLFQWV